MASSDLNYLYSTKATIENYYAIERLNESSNKLQDSEYSAVSDNKKARLAEADKKIQKVKSSTFFKKRGVFILLSGLLAFVLFVFASLTFLKGVISPDISLVVDNYAEYIENGGNAPNGFDKSNKRVLTDTSLALIAGNILLVSIVGGFIAIVACSFVTKKSENQTYVTGGALALCAIAVIFIFLLPSHSRNVWGLSPSIGTLGIVFKGLFYMIFGIGRISSVTHSYFFFVAILQVIFYTTLISFVRAREKFKLSNNVREKIAALEAMKKQIEAEANKKYIEIADKWNAKKKPNKYATAYFNLPKYLQNYSTVCSLIWAIENGYAKDIVGARNYWDRKASDAAMQRRFDQIQSTADAALRAAQTPTEINVTVWN